MKTLINKIILSLLFMLLAVSLPRDVYAHSHYLKQHKLTGTVVSNDERYNSAAIVNDKIWWLGQTYLVVDGEIAHPITPSDKVNKFTHDLATLVKVENSKVTILYKGELVVLEARKKSDG